MEFTIDGLLHGGIPIGVWGALRGFAWDVGTEPGGNGGDLVILGDEFGVLLGDDWWFYKEMKLLKHKFQSGTFLIY